MKCNVFPLPWAWHWGEITHDFFSAINVLSDDDVVLSKKCVIIGLSVIMFDLHDARVSDLGGTFHAMYNVANSQFRVHNLFSR